MADLFISYARTDRDLIEKLALKLEASAYSVWWDRHIVGGDDFSARIEQELAAAGAVVVAWSAAGSASRWVKDEAAFAAEHGKLVAISLDGSIPPMGFRQYHAIDLSADPENFGGSAFDALEQAIATRLGTSETVTASDTPVVSYAAGPASGNETVPWIAITPIRVRGKEPDLQELADDLNDSLASGLARFSYLKVASKASAAEARAAGARYVLDSTLRQSGSRLRLSAHLRTTGSARQVWGQDYDRPFDSDTIFDLHDDLTDRVITAVADPYGALMRDLAVPVLDKNPEDMTTYEALIRHFVYRQRVTADDHAIASRAVELAVERDPGNADLWAALAFSFMEGYKNRYHEQENAARRALQCARRAIEIDSRSAYAQYALFETSFFNQDVPAAKQAALRALELNPRDTDAMAMIGILTMFLGEWEAGFECFNRARKLNPNGPGWYWFGGFYYHYMRGENEQALDCAQRADMPQYHAYHAQLAIALAECGRIEEARKEAQQFVEHWPIAVEAYAENIRRWFFATPELATRFRESLLKAGLELP